jgi:ankyrin repeat protein
MKALGNFGELNFTEVMTICMCVDGLCATITMTLSDKTTLASRWFVYLASMFQILAMILIFATLGLWNDAATRTDCCTTVVWWGVVSSCRELPRTTICYFLARTITLLHGTYLALIQTSDFDEAKKLHDLRSARGSSDSRSGFERLPAPAFSAYWNSLPGMVLAWAGLEKHLRVADSGSISDWGQSAALITAIAGILHWGFVFNRGWTRLKTSRFDLEKSQFLDYTRINQGHFPDALEMEGVPLLQQSLFLSASLRDNQRAEDILSAIRRREARGERISIDFVDPVEKETPLLIAIERGSSDLVIDLLKQGASVDVPQTESAIITATKTGQWEILHCLLDTGKCSVASIIKALHILNDRFEERSGIISATASMLRYIRTQSAPMCAETQYELADLASRSKHLAFFETFIQCGLLNQYSRTSPGMTFLEAILKNPILINTVPHWFYGTELLLSALLENINSGNQGFIFAMFGPDIADIDILRDSSRIELSNTGELLPWGVLTRNPEVVKKLLGIGAPIGRHTRLAHSRRGMEILSRRQLIQNRFPRLKSYTLDALQLAAWMGLIDMVNILLEAGFNINASAAVPRGRTALQAAAENGHEATVRLLLDTGKVDVDSKDNGGWTPLSQAAANGQEATVKQLLDTGKAVADSKDKDGRTPLSWAARNGKEAIVKQLLDTGKVDVDSKDKDGRTPLSWAAWNGKEAIVKQLLDTGKVDVNSKDNHGQTPLSWAAGNSQEATVKQLLDTGKVDVNSKDNHGQTPLSWAAGNSQEATVKQLLNTGKAKPAIRIVCL